jgi:hypothetical protein
MKCFYDPTQDAIGICKCCGRGLSASHAVDLDKGLACRGRCEEDVRQIIDNLKYARASTQMLKGSGKAAFANSFFLLAAGATFSVMGITLRFDPLLITLGSIFLIFGGYILVRAGKINAEIKNKQK